VVPEGYKTVWQELQHVMSLSFDDPQLLAGAVFLLGPLSLYRFLSFSFSGRL